MAWEWNQAQLTWFSEAAAFGEPQQALNSALHRGSFEDVAEPGPQRNLLDVNVEACISTALMSFPFMVPKTIWEEEIWSAVFWKWYPHQI